ncbi:MAG: aspartate aminotransferase family protein [Planctomycetes bacterium]|nr:aspartate aminotransferase family protein [Planctomycetota bacterium]
MDKLTFQQIKETFDHYVIPNYSRNDVAYVRAEGSYIWDSEGNRHVDLMPGWGTTTVGHCHPRIVSSIQRQAARLIHVDNTFYNIPQGLLAERISERSFGGQCFFCNSGTEAVEGAMKLARLWGEEKGRYKIITMRDSFHGRTFGSITATGQDKYHKGYLPLLPGFIHVPFNDFDALSDAVDEETCAILMEPVQGEGGINIADTDYLENVRDLCDSENILLIFDEVQTGIGRTGKWFGYQNFNLEPDIITLAKALGGGFPIGAFAAKPQIADHLVPGTHASTFGGNPLGCAAAIAVFDLIEEENLLEQGLKTSAYVLGRLEQIARECPIVEEVRGIGMMIGVELNRPGKAIFEYCLDRFVRINCTHDTVLRMLPALNIGRAELDEGLQVLEEAIRKADKQNI